MMRVLAHRFVMTAAATCLVAAAACAQWSFQLDTSFRSVVVQRNVNAIHVLTDGGVFLSGLIRFAGDMSDRGSAKLLTDGSRDLTFPSFPQTTGGGKIVPWLNGKFYVAAFQPRRMLANGLVDPSFGPIGIGPYFQSGTIGDYHVFPDGRVLISGSHTLSDAVRGFVGSYELIWFTNTGYLDTTRTHRNANGPIYEFKEMLNGQFICTCNCSQYEGQPVSRVFRVNADGSLDTAFQSSITAGNIYEIEGLPDGRVLLGGNFRFSGAPQDTVRLARLLPDGQRDAAFASPSFAGYGLWWPPSGTIVFDIFPFHGGTYIIAGQFVAVNGQERKGLCMVDGDGALLPAFDSCGTGPFTYQSTTNATPLNVYWSPDSTAIYICGTYASYTDGTTTDPSQRFVSRLLVSELTTAVQDPAAPSGKLFTLQPNPAQGSVTFVYNNPRMASAQGSIVVRDLVGRVIISLPMNNQQGQQTWGLQAVSPGTYLVQYLAGGQVLHTEKLLVQ